jgi:hypothetical protein
VCVYSKETTKNEEFHHDNENTWVGAMNGENRPLVTDELVEFEK